MRAPLTLGRSPWRVRVVKWMFAVALALVSCGAKTATPKTLVEGYCPRNEADRCYFDSSPMDGF
jgi:hypothetical protein